MTIPRWAGAVSPTPAELAEARRWVAAKFEGVSLDEPQEPGLVVRANHGPVQLNARSGKPLKIGDQAYARGLYCHAISQVVARLPGRGQTFSAVVGLDSHAGGGRIVFAVRVGDQEVANSGVRRITDPGLPLRVDLNGATEFTLEVGDAGDGIACDQANWAEAKVTLPDGETVWLDDLPLFDWRFPYPTDPPFSFTYGGRPSAELLPTWKRERASRPLDERRTEHVLAYTDPQTGLVIRCVAVEYHDFPAVEWTLYFQNSGAADTPILADIQALDTRLERDVVGEFVLHHHTGDHCSPTSYEPHQLRLEPQANHRFAPAGGRPTNGAFPYFNVEWPGQGVIAAIGWPGQWSAQFSRDEGNGLRIRGGQELTRFKLLPGEEVRTPLVTLMFWKGDRVRAQNLWRRWMLAHNLPRTSDGQLPPPILSSCSGGFFPGLKCNEADEFRFIDTYTQEGIPLDYWWMDAGWYPCGDGWPNVGTWEPDPERFPRGIKAVSDHAHEKGLKLILWFEPERVAPGTWLAENHPEWILGGKNGGLLNLGNPEARQWLTDHVDRFLTEQGIDLYRQDFNIDPLGYWRANDAEDRQGITEIRHVEGYLAYWDELQRRHPGLLIDSCASGGRRNDLETLRRAVPLLRSDYQSFSGDPGFAPGNQGHTYGISSWFPYYGQGTYYNEDQLVYNVRSHFCPAFGFCVDVRREGIDWARFRRLTEDWQKISPYFLGDFYPLTSYHLEEDVWMAWQFHRADLGEGVVQAFRRADSPYESARFPLRGLEAEARYLVTDLDVPGGREAFGRELMEEGLFVRIEARPGAAIFIYHQVAGNED